MIFLFGGGEGVKLVDVDGRSSWMFPTFARLSRHDEKGMRTLRGRVGGKVVGRLKNNMAGV